MGLTFFSKYAKVRRRSLCGRLYFSAELREKIQNMVKNSQFTNKLLKTGLSLGLTTTMLFGGQNAVLAGTFTDIFVGSRLTLNDERVVLGPIQPPSVQDILVSVCKARGYGDECAKILLGMSWKESQHVATAIGDGGRARGWFQIHYRLHNIPLSCAEDLVCSANWTIDYLQNNGYPKYVKYAVQCHNSCGFKNWYAESALWNGQRLWNTGVMTSAQVAIATR